MSKLPPHPKRLYEVTVAGNGARTGSTRHTRNGAEIPGAATLAIVRYDGDSGVYLLHLDAQGGELSDTYHDDPEDAMEQATFEFDIPRDRWSAFRIPSDEYER